MSKPTRQDRRTTNQHMLAGSSWALVMRWVIRGIGMVSVIILARLLTPQDFGIVAMSSIAISFLDSFAQLGVHSRLIRQQNATEDHCNTAWTLNLIQHGVVGLLIFASAPLAATYFDEPRLVAVLHVLALFTVVTGLENIGMVLVRKELDFAKDFRFNVYDKLLGVAVTIGFALVLQNYWALVAGKVTGSVLGLFLSYRMHPYRPRWSLACWRDYLGFAISAVQSNIARFLRNKVDVVVVGGMGSTGQLGGYNVAASLATMATREMAAPIWRGLFPTFARLVDKPAELGHAYRRMLNVLATLAIPLAVGLALVAQDAVTVVLGGQWAMAVPWLRWLAIGAVLTMLVDVLSNNILFVTGNERHAVRIMWLYVAFLAPTCVVASKMGGIEAVAMATTICGLIMLPIAALILSRAIGVTLRQIVAAVWRPVVAVLAMVLVVRAVHGGGLAIPVLRLVIDVAAGAAAYSATLVACWMAAGRPDGIERHAWSLVVRRLRRSA